MIQRLHDLARSVIVAATFNAQCTLPNRRCHHVDVKRLDNSALQTEPPKPSQREDDGLIIPIVELAQARVDITAYRTYLDITTLVFQLRLPS